MSSWLDRLFTGALLLLVLTTPLALGSVHPWAYGAMERIVFLLVLVGMVKLIFQPWISRASAATLAPLLLLGGLCAFQLLRIPPPLLRLVSPATPELYARALPGWPKGAWKAHLDLDARGKAPTWHLLPTPGEVARGAPVPFDPRVAANEPDGADFTAGSGPTREDSGGTWRSLSIAPSLTRIELGKLWAYVSLLALVLLYPFGSRDDEWRFVRRVLATVLATGLFVATLGLVQRLTWNGRILWFYVPLDWAGAPRIDAPQTSGPFVGPSHFAGYLAMILPLALVATISPRCLAARGREAAVRALGGLAGLVLLAALLLSLSRGGWLAAITAAGLLLTILLSAPVAARPALLRRSRPRVITVSLVLAGAAVTLVLVLVGPALRTDLDLRIAESVATQDTLLARLATWTSTLTMARDFPLFGVGLGAWQDLFPRYASRWSPAAFLAAHNDYLELLAETGVAGVSLAAWFLLVATRRLRRALGEVGARDLPVMAALVAALAGVAVHEVCDFNLQIPASALLFTLLLGLALRLAGRNAQNVMLPAPMSICVAIVWLGLAAQFYGGGFAVSRPGGKEWPRSADEAVLQVDARPARSAAQIALSRWLREPGRSRHVEIAVWLDPLNPRTRDLLAETLLAVGREEDGLVELERSVFLMPDLDTHPALARRLLPWLSPGERSAVERGLTGALAAGAEGAAASLAGFHVATGRLLEAARAYERAALDARTPESRTGHLVSAGSAYLAGGDSARAEAVLRGSVEATPWDPRPYRVLASAIIAHGKPLAAVKLLLADAVERGTDGYELSLALADAAESAGDLAELRSALLSALDERPSSLEGRLRLGHTYLRENDFDRAAIVFRRAVDLHPASATALFHLGVAEEGRYRFAAAEEAYRRALEFDPTDEAVRSRERALRDKVAGGTITRR